MLTFLTKPYAWFNAWLTSNTLPAAKPRENPLSPKGLERIAKGNLQQVFTYLEPEQFNICREVNQRWYNLVAEIEQKHYEQKKTSRPFGYKDYFIYHQRVISTRPDSEIPLISDIVGHGLAIYSINFTFEIMLLGAIISKDCLLNFKYHTLSSSLYVALLGWSKYINSPHIQKIYMLQIFVAMISRMFFKIAAAREIMRPADLHNQSSLRNSFPRLLPLLLKYGFTLEKEITILVSYAICVGALGNPKSPKDIAYLSSLIFMQYLAISYFNSFFSNSSDPLLNLLEATWSAAAAQVNDLIQETQINPALRNHYYFLKNHIPLSPASKQLNEACHINILERPQAGPDSRVVVINGRFGSPIDRTAIRIAAEQGLLDGIFLEHPYHLDNENVPKTLWQRLLTTPDFEKSTKIQIALAVILRQKDKTKRLALFNQIQRQIIQQDLRMDILNTRYWPLRRRLAPYEDHTLLGVAIKERDLPLTKTLIALGADKNQKMPWRQEAPKSSWFKLKHGPLTLQSISEVVAAWPTDPEGLNQQFKNLF